MADKQQNLLGHLDELRNRLIVTALVFVGSFLIGFMYVEEIYKWFVRDLDYKLIVLGPSDIIWVYFMLAGVIALVFTIPVLALQVWLFVKPALKPFEVKKTLLYIPWLFILFIVGLCFGYFVIFPTVLHFIVGLSGDLFETSFTVEKYFKFLMNLTLPIACLFELPVVVMFLTTIGVLNPFFLSKMRKYAYFILVILATLLSPPDFISQTLVAIPLLLLYEISISLSKFVYNRRMKRLEASYEDEDIEDEEDITKAQ